MLILIFHPFTWIKWMKQRNMFSIVTYVIIDFKILEATWLLKFSYFFLYPSTKYFFDKFIYIESIEDTLNVQDVRRIVRFTQNFNRNNANNVSSCDLGTGHLPMRTKKTQRITIGKTNWLAGVTSLEISRVFFVQWSLCCPSNVNNIA